ncbi:MAG TPA: T9SS type A sorting domain-containing protein [Flavobacteriales bacterium]|nr:T9SS type A sorting domain-containing protein [Flavobacteriales bacterium]
MKALLFAAAVLWGTAARTQYWRALGRGTVGPTEVQTLFGDSVSDRLLAGGTFLHILNDNDTLLGFGQAAWDGLRWDSVAHRIQEYGGGESAQQTFWFLRFKSILYACGGFTLHLANGEYNRYLARLDTSTGMWGDLGCTNNSAIETLTLVPKHPDTTLYATGFYGIVCGFPESCVFRYDGSAFHVWEPFAQIPYYTNNYVGTVFDFQGMTYLTGTVRDPLGPGFVTFLRWNGTAWEHVPGWNTEGAIKEVLVRDGTLYVAGTFRKATGGPGNMVASFDGQQWNDLGGGLLFSPLPTSGAALDLEWHHGNLLACGLFNVAGNAPCHSIAQWDGQRWCAFPGDIRSTNNALATLYDMAIWRDSLYVCGGIRTVDGDTMRQVIQWIGGDAVAACSTTGIQEVAPGGELSITPLPVLGQWAVHLPGAEPWRLSVVNSAGQQVMGATAAGRSTTVDLRNRASGMYLLRAVAADGTMYHGKIVQR